MNIEFVGKRALVTGAGKGVGRLLSQKLAEGGAKVVAVSRTQSDLDSLKATNPELIETICLDIGDWNATTEALKDVGHVDLLVNNAAVLERELLGNIKEETVNRVFDINLKSVINITQMVANEMKSSGKGGSIVNVSSVLGEQAVPLYTVYSASKAAMNQMTKNMAIEYGPHKIRVNSVNPGLIRTPMSERVGLFDPANAGFAKERVEKTPLRRLYAEPGEVVDPILYLLSDRASMITGASLTVDGGLAAIYA